MQLLDERLDLGLDLQLAHGVFRAASEHRGDERHRHHGNRGRDGLEELTAQPLHGFEARSRTHDVEVDSVPARVRPHRDRRSEVHAGIAEAVPAPPQHEHRLMGHEPEEGRDDMRAGIRIGLRVELVHQETILEHAVVVDPHRNEDEVAFAVRVERRQHVADQAQPGLAQTSVAAQVAFGIESPGPPRRPSPPERTVRALGDREDRPSFVARNTPRAT